MQNFLSKLSLLEKFIKKYSSAIVAYSGGVDSSLLLYICKKILNERVLAVTAYSETYTPEELKLAKNFTKQYNIKHKIIKTCELKNKDFVANSVNRCYFCKYELFNKIEQIRRKYNYEVIFDGTTYDDIKDYRPGEQAKKIFNVVSPLKEVKLTKNEIRMLSKKLNLPTAMLPHNACLSSRIVFGEKITKEKLKKAYIAEKIIKTYWNKFFRIRIHNNELISIEVNKTDIQDFFKNINIDNLTKKLKKLNFKFITFDLEGYIPIGLRWTKK